MENLCINKYRALRHRRTVQKSFTSETKIYTPKIHETRSKLDHLLKKVARSKHVQTLMNVCSLYQDDYDAILAIFTLLYYTLRHDTGYKLQ